MVNKNKAKKAAYHCVMPLLLCTAVVAAALVGLPAKLHADTALRPHARRWLQGCPRQAGGSRGGGRGDPPGGSPRGPGAGCPGTPHALSHRTYHRRACCVAHYYRTRKHLMRSAVTAARGSSIPARRSASTTPSASPEMHNSKGQFTLND